MNRDIAKRWVEALRSGEYKQSRSMLRNKHGYCCLGVLCELAVADGAIPPAVIDEDAIGYYNNTYTLPPVEVKEWAGNTSQGWYVNRPQHVDAEDDLWVELIPVSFLNDAIEMSFPQIADLIEQTYVTEAVMTAEVSADA
jgi:hypothetical protein